MKRKEKEITYSMHILDIRQRKPFFHSLRNMCFSPLLISKKTITEHNFSLILQTRFSTPMDLCFLEPTPQFPLSFSAFSGRMSNLQPITMVIRGPPPVTQATHISRKLVEEESGSWLTIPRPPQGTDV